MSLAEHVYVSAIEPANPVVGALWIDTSNEKLFRCSSLDPAVWTEVSVAGGGGGGADVKGGVETAITENTTRAVAFGTAFVGTPNVVGTIADSSARDCLVAIRSITTAGFDIFVHKVAGGAAADRDVQWIATDAGDP